MAEIETTDVVKTVQLVEDDGWRPFEQRTVAVPRTDVQHGKRRYLPMGENVEVPATETVDRPHVNSGKMGQMLRGPRG